MVKIYYSILTLILCIFSSCSYDSNSNNSNRENIDQISEKPEQVVKKNFAFDINDFLESSLAFKATNNYNFIKIITECGDEPEPESSSIDRYTYSNNNIEIVFDNKLNIIEIINLGDNKTIGELIQEDIENGIELSPWDEMMMNSNEHENRDLEKWDEIWGENAEVFKSLADKQSITWDTYSGPNNSYVEHLSKYYIQLVKNEDVLCAWCFSFQINEIYFLNSLNSRNCSNSNFSIFDSEFTVNDKTFGFDKINYLDNTICVYTKSSNFYIASQSGLVLDLPNDTRIKENLLYNSQFEFFLPESGSERGYYKIYEFEKSRQTVLSELSKLGGEYIGGGTQKTTTSRQVWKESLSIEQNMMLYGNSAWATDVTNKRSDWVNQVLNTQNRDLTLSIYNIKSIEKNTPVEEENEGENVDKTRAKCKVSNLNIRSAPEICDNVIGKLQKDQLIIILDTINIKIDKVKNVILNQETFIELDGGQILFQQGVVMELIEEIDSTNYKVVVNDRNQTAIIASSKLDLINEEIWVKFQLKDGRVGYVYQKFVE